MNRELRLFAPMSSKHSQPFLSPVQVMVYRDGLPDAGLVSGLVTLNLVPVNAGAGVLTGMLSQQVNGGIAVFNNLAVDAPGFYKLQASCGNVPLRYIDQEIEQSGLPLVWKMSHLPTVTDPSQRGRWIQFQGINVPNGTWAKIIDVGTDPLTEDPETGAELGGPWWLVEQPMEAGNLNLVLELQDPMPLQDYRYNDVSIRYNRSNLLAQPGNWAVAGTDFWFDWRSTNLAIGTPDDDSSVLMAESLIEIYSDQRIQSYKLKQGEYKLTCALPASLELTIK